MALIYKLTNLKNNKFYIGKTTRTLEIRWKEHCWEANNNRYFTKLYEDMRKYGIENFKKEIIEDNILDEELDKKEQFYIDKFDARNENIGYNEAFGGNGGRTSSKLNEDQVDEIISILKDTNNIDSFYKIGEQYNVSFSVIASINKGESWYRNEENYPIRKYQTVGLSINKNIYKQIVNDLLNNNILLKDMQNKYGLSEGQITAINNGYYCYNNDNEYYKGIYNGEYPIRKAQKNITEDKEFINIFYDVLFSSLSITKIGEKHNIKGNTLTYIINGKRRKELTNDYLVPMRKNLQHNQDIFKKKYPDYKGGD